MLKKIPFFSVSLLVILGIVLKNCPNQSKPGPTAEDRGSAIKSRTVFYPPSAGVSGNAPFPINPPTSDWSKRQPNAEKPKEYAEFLLDCPRRLSTRTLSNQDHTFNIWDCEPYGDLDWVNYYGQTKAHAPDDVCSILKNIAPYPIDGCTLFNPRDDEDKLLLEELSKKYASQDGER